MVARFASCKPAVTIARKLIPKHSTPRDPSLLSFTKWVCVKESRYHQLCMTVLSLGNRHEHFKSRARPGTRPRAKGKFSHRRLLRIPFGIKRGLLAGAKLPGEKPAARGKVGAVHRWSRVGHSGSKHFFVLISRAVVLTVNKEPWAQNW